MKKVNFVVIVPSYNNEKWVELNLGTIFGQNYPHFRVLYINDASEDTTGQKVERFVKEQGVQNRIIIQNNKKRKGALRNIYEAVFGLEETQVALIVDGDDFLAHPDALSRIAEEYQDPEAWMTYGNFRTEPYIFARGAKDFSKMEKGARSCRNYPLWITHHPISFYAALFHHIQKKDLLYKGKFFEVTYDLALGFPLFEMAGKHLRFIQEILYIHNLKNPLSDFRKSHDQQEKMAALIRKKEPYKPLKRLF